VHRDVKPGNVLLTDDDRALISDFGIARTHGDATLTRSGMVTGTPSYFAPELARGGAPTPAADVWALGATLYAAVEGHPPYVDTESNALALLARIANEPTPAPVHAEFLTDALARMLDHDPRSRWAMDDVAHTLHRLHEKYAEEDTREQTAPRAVAAVPVGAAAVAGAADPEPTTAEAPAPPPATNAPARRRPGAVLPIVLALLVVIVVAAGLAWWASGNNTDPNGSAAPPTGKRGTTPSHSAPTHSKPSRSASPTPSATPTPSPSASTSPSAGTSPGGTAPAAHGRLEFPRSYYGVLPGDTSAAWQMLSPGYRRSMGYDNYRGFWDTISSVSVGDVSSAGSDAVDVALTYTKDDGSTSSETRRLYLQRSGDGWVITSDQVVG